MVATISVCFICVSIFSFCFKTHPNFRVPLLQHASQDNITEYLTSSLQHETHQQSADHKVGTEPHRIFSQVCCWVCFISLITSPNPDRIFLQHLVYIRNTGPFCVLSKSGKIHSRASKHHRLDCHTQVIQYLETLQR